MTKIILASASPRRKEIMDLLNIPYEIKIADIDEKINKDNDLVKEIENISYLKALKIFKENKDTVVIGADTIVVVNNEILGKPKSKQEAKQMLEKLQNNFHHVITGVTILSSKQSETFSNVSKVIFNPITSEEIDEYINTNEPMDKAGAYAIQGLGAKFINSIEGDYYAIMGLPISELYKRLKKYF